MKHISVKKVLFSSVAAAGILLSAAAPVQAATPSTSGVKGVRNVKKNKDYTIKDVPSLTKQGYRLTIPTNVGRLHNEVISGKENYNRASQSLDRFKATVVKPSQVKNVKFRVEKVAEFHTGGFGAPEYFVASKDKQYYGWFTQAQLEYYKLHDKSFAGVYKPLKKMAESKTGRVSTKKNTQYFNQAMAAAKKLPKSAEKNYIISSLNQLKKNGNINNEGKNLMLFGIY